MSHPLLEEKFLPNIFSAYSAFGLPNPEFILNQLWYFVKTMITIVNAYEQQSDY